MRINIKQSADGIILRPLDEADLPLIREWRNTERQWFTHTDIITPLEHKRWWEQYQKSDDDYFFIIESGGVPSGCVSVYDIRNGDAEYGRCIVPSSFSCHRLLEKGSRLLFWACDSVLDLDRLFLIVKSNNLKAIHVYRKLGFVVQDESDCNWLMEKHL